MNIVELIEILNQSGEQTRIEAKTGTEIGKSILETICAFANEPGLGGGTLLLGVQKIETANGLEYCAVGIRESEKVIDNLVSQCRTVFNQPIHVQVSQELVGGKMTIVSIFVPEVNNGNKPIYTQSV